TRVGLAALLVGEDRAKAFTPATDVHALGAMLSELVPDAPRELESICLKCREKEPGYPSAAALAEDLRRFRTGEVLFIDDLDDVTQQERWARRAGYEILELLGQTREGFTYKARQLALDRVVILKRIASRYRFVPPAKEGFRWEARLLARVRHPNIVQLY